MFQVILEQRKRREMDPTLEVLRSSVSELDKGSVADAHVRRRLLDMLDFFETMSSCYQDVRSVPASALRGFLKVKGKIRRLLAG